MGGDQLLNDLIADSSNQPMKLLKISHESEGIDHPESKSTITAAHSAGHWPLSPQKGQAAVCSGRKSKS